MRAAAEIEQLVNDNVPLAHYMAARWQHLDSGDALSCALAGLHEAAKTFDPARGRAFGTYAAMQMRWHMGKINPGRRSLKKGREAVHVALDAPRGYDDDVTLAEVIPDGAPLPWEAGEQARENHLMLALVDRLPERWREIITRRFGIGHEEHTLEQVGAILGITRERVRQLEAKAFALLRKMHHEASWRALAD